MQEQEIITFKKGFDKDNLHEIFCPSALFQIPSTFRIREYTDWLTTLFKDFIRELSSDARNTFEAERFYFSEVGEEGGISMVTIGEGEWFDYCKLFVFDGESSRNISDWKGIWMRNHMDQIGQTRPLYALAEKFELFLQKRNIPYSRFGNKIGEDGLFQQVTIE